MSKYPPSPVDLSRDAAVAKILAGLETVRPQSFPAAVDALRRGVRDLGTALIGVAEIGTTNRGYWVDRLESTTGATGQSWCMSLQDWLVQVACKALGLPDIMRRNDAGTQRFAAWAETQKYTVSIADAKLSDVFIWQQTGDPIHGHAANLYDMTRPPLVTLEGNTSSKEASRDGGTIAVHTYANGTGATKTRRFRCAVSLELMAAAAWRDVKWGEHASA